MSSAPFHSAILTASIFLASKQDSFSQKTLSSSYRHWFLSYAASLPTNHFPPAESPSVIATRLILNGNHIVAGPLSSRIPLPRTGPFSVLGRACCRGWWTSRGCRSHSIDKPDLKVAPQGWKGQCSANYSHPDDSRITTSQRGETRGLAPRMANPSFGASPEWLVGFSSA